MDSPCGCQGAGACRLATAGPDRNSQQQSLDSHDGSDDQRPGLDRTRSSSGGQSAVEPPGPIPNPEVKRRCADDSETIGLVKVGRRQVYAPSMETWTGLFFLSRWRVRCGARATLAGKD